MMPVYRQVEMMNSLNGRTYHSELNVFIYKEKLGS